MIQKICRRNFLLLAAGSSMSGFGIYFGLIKSLTQHGINKPESGYHFSPSVLLYLNKDNKLLLYSPRIEMGQGVFTAFSRIISDSLDFPISNMEIRHAKGDHRFGEQGTFVSSSIQNFYVPLKELGQTARAALLIAAAQKLSINEDQLKTDSGFIIYKNERYIYGDFAKIAQSNKLPSQNHTLQLSQPSSYFNSKKNESNNVRVDLESKIRGTAVFGLDYRESNQVYSVLLRNTFLEDIPNSLTNQLKEQPSTIKIIDTRRGIACIASHSHAAEQNAKAIADYLRKETKKTPWMAPKFSFQDLKESAKVSISKAGLSAYKWGSPKPAHEEIILHTAYFTPYIAHLNMEVMNATVIIVSGAISTARIYTSTQSPYSARKQAAEFLGFSIENIELQPCYVGTGLGRRAAQDYVLDACAVAEKYPNVPVQCFMPRWLDLEQDFYRPCAWQELAALQDKDSFFVRHRIATPSIEERALDDMGIDESAVEGAYNPNYAFPNGSVEWCRIPSPIPVGFMRSVGHMHTAFAHECFVNDLANHLGEDPLTYRFKMASRTGLNHKAARITEKMLQFQTTLPKNNFIGSAYHESFGSGVGILVQLSQNHEVSHIYAFIDAGKIVDSKRAESQIEGALILALSQWKHESIPDFTELEFQFSTIATYPIVRLNESPKINVYFLESTDPPSGIGEIGVPPTVAAIRNAFTKIKKINYLPFKS